MANRRVANFLSTARLYRDQNKGELKRVFGRKSAVAVRVDESLRALERAHVHYRAIEALRDHVQHRDLPVRNVRIGTVLDHRFAPPRAQVMVRILVDYDELVAVSGR